MTCITSLSLPATGACAVLHCFDLEKCSQVVYKYQCMEGLGDLWQSSAEMQLGMCTQGTRASRQAIVLKRYKG